MFEPNISVLDLTLICCNTTFKSHNCQCFIFPTASLLFAVNTSTARLPKKYSVFARHYCNCSICCYGNIMSAATTAKAVHDSDSSKPTTSFPGPPLSSFSLGHRCRPWYRLPQKWPFGRHFVLHKLSSANSLQTLLSSL